MKRVILKIGTLERGHVSLSSETEPQDQGMIYDPPLT